MFFVLVASNIEQFVGGRLAFGSSEGIVANEGDEVFGGVSGQVGGDFSGRSIWLVGEENSSSATNVGARHRGSTDSLSGGRRANPSGGDRLPRSEDFDASSVVGERGALVNLSVARGGGGGRSSGGGIGGAGRGDVAGILVFVTGGNGEEDASLDGRIHGVVESSAKASSEGHVGNSGPAVLLIRSDVIDTSNHTSVGSRTIAAKDLDADEGNVFSDTVGSSANCSSDVGTVSIAIGVLSIAGKVGTEDGSSTEINVLDVDAGVDDEGINSSGGLLVGVHVVQDELSVVDSVQSPSGISLEKAGFLRGAHDLVGLDEINDVIFGQEFVKDTGREASGVTKEGVRDAVRVEQSRILFGLNEGVELLHVSIALGLGGIGFENDNVLIRNNILGGFAEGNAEGSGGQQEKASEEEDLLEHFFIFC